MAVLDQCAMKQIRCLDGLDEQWAREFGLIACSCGTCWTPVPATIERDTDPERNPVFAPGLLNTLFDRCRVQTHDGL